MKKKARVTSILSFYVLLECLFQFKSETECEIQAVKF